MYAFAEKRPSQVPIVVLDTETTGLHPWLGNRIIEIGAVRLENWQVTHTLNYLVQPGRKIEPKASAVNGITDADLVGKPSFADIADELISMLDGALIVAHNAAFDAGFLGMELGLCGEGVDTAVYHTPWLCTLTLARNYFHFGRNNLTHIARQLGVRMGTAHRALSDVYMTADILKQMVHQLQKQRMHTVGDLLHAQGSAITMPLLDTVPLPVLLRDAIANRHRL
ncbi:MAG: 3'-5' exonuclease [Chloroflexi bacterium]|nr:3'-5' exonuclease [Chloroflexota bacterium]